MLPEAKECKQCGWDVSHNGPPSTDPGDTKARIGVLAGLVAAYMILGFFIQGSPAPALAESARAPQPAPQYVAASELQPQPPSGRAMAIGTLPSGVAPTPVASNARIPLITIKVADSKGSTIPARDALQYVFSLPETDQKCALVGFTKGVGGYGRNIEVFLLTDVDYVFWNANPAAIAASSWETFRGSENTIDYELHEPGVYHFVVSNQMSSSPQAVAVKAHVKCVK